MKRITIENGNFVTEYYVPKEVVKHIEGLLDDIAENGNLDWARRCTMIEDEVEDEW